MICMLEALIQSTVTIKVLYSITIKFYLILIIATLI